MWQCYRKLILKYTSSTNYKTYQFYHKLILNFSSTTKYTVVSDNHVLTFLIIPTNINKSDAWVMTNLISTKLPWINITLILSGLTRNHVFLASKRSSNAMGPNICSNTSVYHLLICLSGDRFIGLILLCFNI